jgi:hypothetical protein
LAASMLQTLTEIVSSFNTHVEIVNMSLKSQTLQTVQEVKDEQTETLSTSDPLNTASKIHGLNHIMHLTYSKQHSRREQGDRDFALQQIQLSRRCSLHLAH